MNTQDEGPTPLFDGGERVLSMTAVESIGAAVAVALEKSEHPQVRDRFLYVHNVTAT